MLSALCPLLIVASLLAVPRGVQPQGTTAEALMGAAQHLQDVEGRYADAIVAYRKVLAAAGVSRATAARAQLMIGVCHERLGENEARAAYQAVLSKYADQKDAVTEAKRRLAALVPPASRATATTMKRVPLAISADMLGSPSPDGRFIAFREARAGNVVVQDLRTGTTRQITSVDPSTIETNGGEILFGPDNDRVAYVWRNRSDSYELHVYDLKSSSDRIVFSYERLNLLCWSPNGDFIVFLDYRNDGLVSALSLRDGSVKVIRNPLQREAYGSAAVSPDGRLLAFDVKVDGANGDHVVIQPIGGGPQTLVATGEGTKQFCGWSPDGKALYFTSDQRGTVDLFYVEIASTGLPGTPTLLQRDLGAMLPLGMTRDGTLFFSRDRNMADVMVADFDADSGRLRSQPIHVDPSSIGHTTQPAWSPDGRLLAYHCAVVAGGSGPTFVNTLCTKSLEDGSIRRLKLDVSIYSALEITWCGEGHELCVKGVNADKKVVTWRLDPQTGRPLGGVPTTSATPFRNQFDAKTRITRTLMKDAEGQETEVFRSREGERIFTLAYSADRHRVALSLFPASRGLGTRRIVLVGTDGSGSTELLQVTSPVHIQTCSFVPRAEYLLCAMSSADPDVDEVWKLAFDGSSRQKLDFMLARIRTLTPSPSGTHLAFVTFRMNRPELWTTEFVAPPRAREAAPRRK